MENYKIMLYSEQSTHWKKERKCLPISKSLSSQIIFLSWLKIFKMFSLQQTQKMFVSVSLKHPVSTTFWVFFDSTIWKQNWDKRFSSIHFEMSRNVVWIMSEGRKEITKSGFRNLPKLPSSANSTDNATHLQKTPSWLYFHELDQDLLTIIYWQYWTNCSLLPHTSKRCLGVKCISQKWQGAYVFHLPLHPRGWLCFVPWYLSSCRRSAKRSPFHAPVSVLLFLIFWFREVIWPLFLPYPLRLIWRSLDRRGKLRRDETRQFSWPDQICYISFAKTEAI